MVYGNGDTVWRVEMYAIRNRKTLKWVYGTDFGRFPHTQRTSEDNVMIFETLDQARTEFKRRMCGTSYEIVPVRVEVLE